MVLWITLKHRQASKNHKQSVNSRQNKSRPEAVMQHLAKAIQIKIDICADGESTTLAKRKLSCFLPEKERNYSQ